MTNPKKYESLQILLSRTNPYILTESHLPENKTLLDNQLIKMEFHTKIQTLVSPHSLYHYLSEYRDKFLIFDVDILQLSKSYLDIIQGAICSSPDSMALWKVQYLHYPEFTFKGKLILCTELTKAQVKKRKRLEFLVRDCCIV